MTTETPAPAPPADPVEYVRLWSDAFSQVVGQIVVGQIVVGQIASSAMPCRIRAESPPELASSSESDLWAVVTSAGGLRGEMSLRLTAGTVLRLAQIFMSEPASPEVQPTSNHASDHPSDDRDAVVELLRQVAGLVSTAAKARWGEIQLRVEGASAAPSWPSAGTYWLQVGEDGPAAMALELVLSAALVAELRAEKTEPAQVEAGRTLTEPASAGISSSPPAGSEKTSGALDLLMDVELGMTMRFGSRKMLLREVLDLNPGSVIELDRRVQEPVELLLDGKLVARGEVVVIEGNYGLRITDATPLEHG